MTLFFYALIEMVTLRLSFLSEKSFKKKNRNYIVGLIWIILFSLIAFRDVSVGNDYKTYIDAMIRVANGNERYYDYTWLSIGFRGFIKIIALSGLPSTVVAYLVSIIIAGATVWFFLKAIIDLSSKPTMSLFILFCFCYIFQCMNQFRQMFAVSVVLFAYKYIDESFAKYCVLIVLAALFHSSAIIMLPMYFLVKLEFNKKIITIYFFSGIAIGVLWTFVRKLIQYSPYAYYLGWDLYDTSMEKTALLNLAVRIILLTICIMYRKKVIIKEHRNEQLYHLVSICTIIQIISVYITMFSRVSTYFYVFYIILLPEVFEAIKINFTKDSRRIVHFSIIFVLILYQLVYFRTQSIESAYDVYKFFFM